MIKIYAESGNLTGIYVKNGNGEFRLDRILSIEFESSYECQTLKGAKMAAAPGFYYVCLQGNWCYCRSCIINGIYMVAKPPCSNLNLSGHNIFKKEVWHLTGKTLPNHVDRLRLYDGRTANQLLNDLHISTENESAAVNNTFTEVLKQVCISKAFRMKIYETTRYVNTASYFKKDS